MHTGCTPIGTSPKYLSQTTAASNVLVLSGNGATYIVSTHDAPIRITEGGAFGMGSMGLGGMHGLVAPTIVAVNERQHRRIEYNA
mmetsp:Transcript_14487/g.23536  ORF Transcript_14487/g.23536 Transcript_14487/m.23536 type:complete len:85 (-) Transcript_14487:126-380(-)